MVKALFIGDTCSATWELFHPLVHISVCHIFFCSANILWSVLHPLTTHNLWRTFLNNSAIHRWRWLHCNSMRPT